MAKLTIIEGNNNDKDNVRALMVKGEAGNDGTSPTATVSKTGKVTTVTVTDKNGTTTAAINDGDTPTATVTKSNNKATISITDINGTTTADVDDGYSPTATVTKLNSVATISITDKNGTTTANVSDGAAGYEVPANGVIGWDSSNTIPNGYEELFTTTNTTTQYDDISVSNDTVTNLGSVQLPAGRYLLIGVVEYPSNSTGYRRLGISTSSSSMHKDRYSVTSVSPASGVVTQLQVINFVKVTETTTFYLNTRHTAGSTLTVSGGIEVISFL